MTKSAKSPKKDAAFSAVDENPLPENRDEPSAGGLRQGLLPWLALLAALSAPLIALVQSFASLPFAASLLLAPVLATRLYWLPGRHHLRSSPRTLLGITLLVIGLSLQLVGILGDAWSIAWSSIPISVVGMAFYTGYPDPRWAALSIGCVPIPTSVFFWTTPWVETLVARVAATPFRWLIPDLVVSGPHLRLMDKDLQLRILDNGLHLAWVLVVLLGYAALYRNESLSWCLRRAVLIAPASAILQVLSTQIAIILTALQRPSWGEDFLAMGAWLTTAIVAVVLIERRDRSNPNP